MSDADGIPVKKYFFCLELFPINLTFIISHCWLLRWLSFVFWKLKVLSLPVQLVWYWRQQVSLGLQPFSTFKIVLLLVSISRQWTCLGCCTQPVWPSRQIACLCWLLQQKRWRPGWLCPHSWHRCPHTLEKQIKHCFQNDWKVFSYCVGRHSPRRWLG